jgi:serine/threonine protein kinase
VGGLGICGLVYQLLATRRVRAWTQDVLIPEGEKAGIEFGRFISVLEDVPPLSPYFHSELHALKEHTATIAKVLAERGLAGKEDSINCQLSRKSAEIQSVKSDQLADTTSVQALASTEPWPLHEKSGEDSDAEQCSRASVPKIPGYEILGMLGYGGMGIVYKAQQVGLRRVVALKMIRDGAFAGPRHVARFQLEARAVARLQHPNIVQIYEIGEFEGQPYFSLEFVSGGSLKQRLLGGPVAIEQAAQLVQTLAQAIEYVHQKGIVHRDLKPANILITADGAAKITDFGFTKLLGDDDDLRPSEGPLENYFDGERESFVRESTHLTHSKAILGTPQYMAPEQAWGSSKEIGPAADIYALGGILYELLTGFPPFRAESRQEQYDELRNATPVRPTLFRPEVPRILEVVCLKCLEKKPNDRYSTAQALADDLRHFLVGEPIEAMQIRPDQKPRF